MKQTENVILLKGLFSPDDAREVLLSLINYKINFHQMKSFSAQERKGTKDTYSEERVRELKESKRMVKEILDEAVKNGTDLKINSTIEIAFGT